MLVLAVVYASMHALCDKMLALGHQHVSLFMNMIIHNHPNLDLLRTFHFS